MILPRHGLSPTEDSLHYRILLGLCLKHGTTWWEKLDNLKNRNRYTTLAGLVSFQNSRKAKRQLYKIFAFHRHRGIYPRICASETTANMSPLPFVDILGLHAGLQCHLHWNHRSSSTCLCLICQSSQTQSHLERKLLVQNTIKCALPLCQTMVTRLKTAAGVNLQGKAQQS